MVRKLTWAVVAVGIALCAPAFAADDKEKTRNPFKVKDVPDPDGEDVKAFAAKVKLEGDAKDANAKQWADEATAGKKGSLDGEWSSRWKGGKAQDKWISGTARVKSVGDRVYILYSDRTNTYLIDARREGKNRLVGRYVNTNKPTDTSPWVGIVVDDERIDGVWEKGSGTGGRWDLRRKIAEK